MKRYQLVPTKRFCKDLRRLRKSGFDIGCLEHVIDLLAGEDPLPVKYRDHALRGKLRGVRECRLSPDWLLLYTKDHDKLLLILVRTGSHRGSLGIE